MQLVVSHMPVYTRTLNGCISLNFLVSMLAPSFLFEDFCSTSSLLDQIEQFGFMTGKFDVKNGEHSKRSGTGTRGYVFYEGWSAYLCY